MPRPRISSPPTVPFSVVAVPAVGSDGRVYVVFQETFDGGNTVTLLATTSSDQGATFGTPVTLAGGVATTQNACNSQGDCTGSPFASVIGLATDGGALVAWNHIPSSCSAPAPPSCAPRIYVQKTTNGGLTWTAPAVASIPPGRTSDRQYGPALSRAPNGRVDLAYYDGAANTFNCNASPPVPAAEDTYYAWSVDGGSTFAPAEIVNNVSSDICVLTSGSLINTGKLLTSDDHSVDIAWGDGRNGTETNTFTDIYFTSLTPVSEHSLAGLVGGDNALYSKLDTQPFQPLGAI